MKLKLLWIALFMVFGIAHLQAQEPDSVIKTLIITEARLGHPATAYCELTNVGDSALHLNQFEFGEIGPWTNHFEADPNHFFRLPNVVLDPGKSFVIAAVFDWGPKMYKKFPYSGRYNEKITPDEMWDIADVKLHIREAPYADPTDSVTPYYNTMDVYNGRSCWYIEQHFPNGDSVVVDQVNGNFDQATGNGRNFDKAYDVAGVPNATNTCILIRKASVTEGDTVFIDDRGIDISNSKWIPIPRPFENNWDPNHRVFWTLGNHGDVQLDETTLTSSTIDINWTDSVLTVPWGVRNGDSLMMQFDYHPGLAWHYDLAPTTEDSAFCSVRPGDVLTVYACGNDLQTAKFDVQVSPPGVGENRVIPKASKGSDGYYGLYVGPTFDVTDKVPGMDTIRDVPYAERVDSLFKYLEKAPNATWEIIWGDGVERVDLKTGDILRVTAENGDTKDYYIKSEPYIPSHNAYLSAITWPDIPDWAKGTVWDNDTIPGFSRNLNDYIISLPPGLNTEPALIAKTEALNTTVKVDRMSNLNGTANDRVVSFTSTAEDDTTTLVYNVQIDKQKEMSSIQPFNSDPFISEFCWQEQWGNYFLELCNPGTRPLDLSDYMIMGQWSSDPAQVLTWNAEPTDAAWMDRYVRYIPGYKWQDSINWKVQPVIAVQDPNVSPIVQPGDVFVIGHINTSTGGGTDIYPWFASLACDVEFKRNNPWDEEVDQTCIGEWKGCNIYIYKILNDSIKQGLKPATDPNDFQLIETWGNSDNSAWVVGGTEVQQINTFIRKPQYWQPKPGFNESFGTNPDDSEWLLRDRAYYDARNVGWPNDILFIGSDLGKHYMNDITLYKSTILSNTYVVSEGYSMEESLRGVVTGTTVTDLLGNIIKADEGQTLTVRNTNGDTLTADQTVADGDSLIVLSADETNTSAYILNVTDEGLSSDAVLTSSKYTIDINGSEGTVSGFQVGETIRDIVSGVVVPQYASMIVIDKDGAYLSLKRPRYDTLYADVPANGESYLKVTAEDRVTSITYRLAPDVQSNEAYVTSFVYGVDQEASLIQYIPRGTTVDMLYRNVIPSDGASLQVYDKAGMERMDGSLYKDDRLVVTAQDGETTRTYFFSILEDAGYLAYVVSDVYNVNQDTKTISGDVYETTPVNEFMGNLIPAPNASIKLEDKDGTVYTSGSVIKESRLRVTSANNQNVVYYNIEVLTSREDLNNSNITLYPNPTTGRVTVAGLEPGNRVHVYSMSGTLLRDIKVQQTNAELSLEGQASGMYFVVVSNDKEVVGRYKLILK